MLLTQTVQANRTQYAEKFGKTNYQTFLTEIIENKNLRAFINQDTVFCMGAKLPTDATGIDAWKQLASSSLDKTVNQSQVVEIVQWTLVYEDPVATIVETKQLRDPVNPGQFISRERVQIVCDTIKASDILRYVIQGSDKLSTPDKTGKVYEVDIYAAHAFVMDQDLTFPGVNLSIMTLPEYFKVLGAYTINLNGRRRKQQEPKPAAI